MDGKEFAKALSDMNYEESKNVDRIKAEADERAKAEADERAKAEARDAAAIREAKSKRKIFNTGGGFQEDGKPVHTEEFDDVINNFDTEIEDEPGMADEIKKDIANGVSPAQAYVNAARRRPAFSRTGFYIDEKGVLRADTDDGSLYFTPDMINFVLNRPLKDGRPVINFSDTLSDNDDWTEEQDKTTPEEVAIAQQAEKEASEPIKPIKPIKKAKKSRMKSNIASEFDDGGDEESYAEWNGEKGYSRPDGFPLMVPEDWPIEDDGLRDTILNRGDKRLGDAVAEYYASQIGKDEDTYANPLTRVRRHKGNIYVDMSGDDPIPFMLTPEDLVEMERAAKRLGSN